MQAQRTSLLRWFRLTPYTDPVLRSRAISTYVVSILLFAAAALFFTTLTFYLLSINKMDRTAIMLISVEAALLCGLSLVALWLTRINRQPLAGLLLLAALYIVILIGLFNSVIYPPVTLSWLVLLTLWMTIPLTVLLTGTQLLAFTSVFSVAVVAIFSIKIVPPDEPVIGALVGGLLIFSSLAGNIGINWLLARSQNDVLQRANLDAAKRLGLVEASSGVTQRILSRLDLDSLMAETVKLVGDTFHEIDGVRLWLVETDRRNAILVATTNADDESGQKIGVGSLNVVGRVTIGGQSILIRDTPDEQSYRRSTLTAGIRSQLVLPLQVASEVIGALDVQSRRLDAFAKDDIDVLQTLSDQIAIAIDNARLYAAAQNSLAENKRLYEQTRNSLREIERLNQQLTGQAWNEYLRARTESPALTLDLSSGQVDNYAEWTSTLAEASRTHQLVTQRTAQGKTLALPILVRNQVIGAMEFELDADQTISAEQLGAVQQVIERMGLSADNVRLFEEAQRIAQREATVNDISTKMQAATSVDGVLSAATKGIAEAFGSARVAIRIGANPHTASPPSSERIAP